MILNNVDSNSSVIDGLFDIVHEVKNSIAVCRGYLDIIDSDRDGDMNKYLSVIRNEINRSTDIISEFMTYRKVNIKKEIIDINMLLNDLCDDMKLFVENKGVSFDYNILDEEIYVDGDYDKLKQVFINFIKNGIEALDKSNGEIRVVTCYYKKKINIFIEDNGCGIDDELLKKIQRESFTTKRDGNGIGVKFSSQIIKLHGGSVNYYSKVGVGTKVVVKLPVVML